MTTAGSTPSPLPRIVIEPARGWRVQYLSEIWENRELLWFLTWRDIKVRYTQAVLGIAWAVLVPFSQMVIFSVVFGRLGGLPSDGLPKPVFYYSALLPWTYFATALTMSSNSLVTNSAMMTKVYFPRILMPMASCVAGLIDFTIAFALLLVMMLFYEIPPGLGAMLLPGIIFIAFITALGTGLFFAALNVKYRDIRYVIPFLIQAWMYITVIVPFSELPERWGAARYLYGLNPMAGVIEGFRWALLHKRMTVERLIDGQDVQVPLEAPWILLSIGLPVALGTLALGITYFRHMEKDFADVV